MLLYLASLAMLAALQADAASAPSADLPDIVVNGQRMKRIKIDTRRDRRTGVQRCVVKRSSGDSGLDTAFCNAVLTCAKTAGTKSDMEVCLAPRLAQIATRPVRPQ
jgi:hypothetical protein